MVGQLRSIVRDYLAGEKTIPALERLIEHPDRPKSEAKETEQEQVTDPKAIHEFFFGDATKW